MRARIGDLDAAGEIPGDEAIDDSGLGALAKLPQSEPDRGRCYAMGEWLRDECCQHEVAPEDERPWSSGHVNAILAARANCRHGRSTR